MAWEATPSSYAATTPVAEPTVLPTTAAPRRGAFARAWHSIARVFSRVGRAVSQMGQRSVIVRALRVIHRVGGKILRKLLPAPLIAAWKRLPSWVRTAIERTVVHPIVLLMHVSMVAVYAVLAGANLIDVGLGLALGHIRRVLAPRIMPVVDRLRGRPATPQAQAAELFVRLRGRQDDGAARLTFADLQEAASGLRHIDPARLPRLQASLEATDRVAPGQPLRLTQVWQALGLGGAEHPDPFAGVAPAECRRIGTRLLEAGHPASAARFLAMAPVTDRQQAMLWQAARDGGDLARLEAMCDGFGSAVTPAMRYDFGRAVLSARQAPLGMRQRALEALYAAHTAVANEARYARAWALGALAHSDVPRGRRAAADILAAPAYLDDAEAQAALGAAAVHGPAPGEAAWRAA